MSPWYRGLPAILLLLPAAIVAQQQPTFRTGVDVVNVDVSVSRGGEHIAGLRASNFEVFDNGVKQKIDKVSVEEVPLECYLVFDVSGSIAGAKLQALEDAANAFVNGLSPRDKVALVTFARDVDVKQPLTADFESFRRAVSEIKAGGQTALFDATLKTVGLRERNDNRAVAVGTCTYWTDSSRAKVDRVYYNNWILEFDDDGRCSSFTEYYMSPRGS
jgi:VWFA-related protein